MIFFSAPPRPFLAAILLMTSLAVHGQLGPTFLDAPPADTTVGCYGDLPTAPTLRAQRLLAGGLIDTVDVVADTEVPALGVRCNGGVLMRTWTATDATGTTTVSQTITFGAATPLDLEITNLLPNPFVVGCNDTIPTDGFTVSGCVGDPVVSLSSSSTQDTVGCARYTYEVTQVISASDVCGNVNTLTRVIQVQDATPPRFDPPAGVMLSCDAADFSPAATGNLSNLTDDCTPQAEIQVATTDQIISSALCGNRFTIRRTWTVTDVCGNSRVRFQNIEVSDTTRPTFTPPPATVTVDCEDLNDPAVVGEPTDLLDNCDATPSVSFIDVRRGGGCAGDFVVDRTYRVSDDCDNEVFFTQVITVQDQRAPVFTTAPNDLLLDCTSFAGTDPRQAFNAWIANLGGAAFTDGCSSPDSLTTRLLDPATGNPPLFPPAACGQPVIRFLNLELTVSDECGNATTAPLRFRQIDDGAVSLTACPVPDTVFTDPGVCSHAAILTAPSVSDACFPAQTGAAGLRLSINGGPTTRRTPGTDTTINLAPGQYDIRYDFADCGGNTANCAYRLTVRDAEAPIFQVCSTDTTVFLSHQDCSVNFTPVTPGATDNCGLPTLSGGGMRTLAPGDHPVRITAADGFGNLAHCDYTVRVRDTIRPRLTCQARAIEVDPAGTQVTFLNPNDFVVSVEEACALGPFSITPAGLDCGQTGGVAAVRIQAEDPSGNVGECAFNASVRILRPQPTASMMTCAGETLRLFANPPTPTTGGNSPYTFEWFAPNGNLVSTQENPVLAGVSNNDQGVYRVVIRGVSGCTAENTVSVAVTSRPAAPQLRGPDAVCQGDASVPLSSPSTYAGAVVYEWFSGPAGGGSLLGTTPTGNFTAPFPGGQNTAGYHLRVSQNGCASAPSATLSVERVPRPTAAVAPDTVRACAGDDVVLEALSVPNAEYFWVGPNGFSATGRSVTLPAALPAESGTYFITTTRRGGCVSEPDSVALIVRNTPSVSALNGTDRICVGDTLRLAATPPNGEAYEFLAPDGRVLAGSASGELLIPVVSMAEAGDWRVRVLSGGCASAPGPIFNVRVTPPPALNPNFSPLPVCEGNDLVLSSGGVTNLNYAWTGPAGFANNAPNPTVLSVSLNQAGTYRVEATDMMGCVGRDSVEVDILPGIRIDSFTISAEECLSGGETVQVFAAVDPVDPNYQYAWTGPEGSSTAAVFTIPDVSLASNGTYTLQIENTAGCRSSTFARTVEFEFAPAAPVRPFPAAGGGNRCLGDTLLLRTNDFGPETGYNWMLPDGSDTMTAQNSLLLVLDRMSLSGDYAVRAMRGNCQSVPSEARTIVVNEPPRITARVDTPVCAGRSLNLTATELAGTAYSWQGPGGFSATVRTPSITAADAGTHAGVYTVAATRNGCTGDTALVTVTIRPTPAAANLAPIAPVCFESGTALELTVNNPSASEYRFGVVGGPVLGTTTGAGLTFTDFSLLGGPGTYPIQAVAIENGCESNASSSRPFTLSSGAGLVADAGLDTTVCEGRYVLQAQVPARGMGRWTRVQGQIGGAIETPDRAMSVVTDLRADQSPYRFAWTLTEGACVGFAADTVTVAVTRGEAAATGGDLIGCVRQEIRLNAQPVSEAGNSGRWTQSLTQELLGVVITDPTDPATTITGLRADNLYAFTWTVMNRCGVSSETIILSLSDPNPFAGPDAAVCAENPSVSLTADEPSLGSRGRWYSPGPVTFADSSAAVTSATDFAPGRNILVWEVDSGFCGTFSRDTVLVDYTLPPLANPDVYELEFLGQTPLTPLDNDELDGPTNILLDAVPPDVGQVTSTGNGRFDFQAGPDFVGTTTIGYTLAAEGCPAGRGEITITVGQGLDCEVPNIFTPNNDGVNDRFVVPCLLDQSRFPDAEMTIYNRWGDEVFRSEGRYENEWDGEFQGNDLPVGTYFYVLKIGGETPLRGHVRIER